MYILYIYMYALHHCACIYTYTVHLTRVQRFGETLRHRQGTSRLKGAETLQVARPKISWRSNGRFGLQDSEYRCFWWLSPNDGLILSIKIPKSADIWWFWWFVSILTFSPRQLGDKADFGIDVRLISTFAGQHQLGSTAPSGLQKVSGT